MIGNIKVNRKHRFFAQGAGFTLVEVLISTAIISIAMVVVVQMFFIFYASAERTYAILRMESEARRILADISTVARESRIDYDFYATVPSAEPQFLAMRDGTGEQSVWWVFSSGGETDLYLCNGKPLNDSCSKPATPVGDPDWAQVNAGDIDLVSGKFAVSPSQDPLFPGATLTPASNQAPFMRIVFQLQSGPADNSTESPIIETAVTPRFYAR
jgi:prepilin-type N-terminal cleavage/methylation domain-containing protein